MSIGNVGGEQGPTSVSGPGDVSAASSREVESSSPLPPSPEVGQKLVKSSEGTVGEQPDLEGMFGGLDAALALMLSSDRDSNAQGELSGGLPGVYEPRGRSSMDSPPPSTKGSVASEPKGKEKTDLRDKLKQVATKFEKQRLLSKSALNKGKAMVSDVFSKEKVTTQKKDPKVTEEFTKISKQLDQLKESLDGLTDEGVKEDFLFEIDELREQVEGKQKENPSQSEFFKWKASAYDMNYNPMEKRIKKAKGEKIESPEVNKAARPPKTEKNTTRKPEKSSETEKTSSSANTEKTDFTDSEVRDGKITHFSDLLKNSEKELGKLRNLKTFGKLSKKEMKSVDKDIEDQKNAQVELKTKLRELGKSTAVKAQKVEQKRQTSYERAEIKLIGELRQNDTHQILEGLVTTTTSAYDSRLYSEEEFNRLPNERKKEFIEEYMRAKGADRALPKKPI
ncbi:hypothetical protein N9Y92_03170 [Chlamydiales bacterium]|nr:hypothetical protein [Chlamydiales bacterium]